MPQIVDETDAVPDIDIQELMKNIDIQELMKTMQQMPSNDGDEDDDDNDNEEEEEEEDDVDLHMVLSQFFLDTKKHRNVCDILCEMKRNMETQNKILVEILNTFKQK